MAKNKAQIRLLSGMSVLLFGAIGILFWGYGIITASTNATWLGKLILGLISILVLIVERFIK